VAEWRRALLTEKDLWREQDSLRRELNGTIHRIWQDAHLAGDFKKASKWEKAWIQVRNCQTEWIGYRAACCGERTRKIAVPIGCNHRLCPLCAHHRSQLARVRIKTLYDRLTHPALITLTIPNLASIRKHDFTVVRQKVRKFIAEHKSWIQGGVYSLETTFNRKDRTWHLHCHILADISASLPSKEEKTILAGRKVCLFTAIKLRLEFDWLRLWTRTWGRKPKADAGQHRRDGDQFDFHSWIEMTRENRLKEWTPEGYRPIPGLAPDEIRRRTAWNRENRRTIDIRPVTDRDGAAREVLKYITKAAGFCDIPEAVELFCDAVRGARLIQTFGSWYGVKLDTVFDPEHMDDWSQMSCACGVNHWEKFGVFFRTDVVWGEAGRWYLKRSCVHLSGGTVPRPTIRFLPSPEEIEDPEWQIR
jgi:hypothetical protein